MPSNLHRELSWKRVLTSFKKTVHLFEQPPPPGNTAVLKSPAPELFSHTCGCFEQGFEPVCNDYGLATGDCQSQQSCTVSNDFGLATAQPRKVQTVVTASQAHCCLHNNNARSKQRLLLCSPTVACIQEPSGDTALQHLHQRSNSFCPHLCVVLLSSFTQVFKQFL